MMVKSVVEFHTPGESTLESVLISNFRHQWNQKDRSDDHQNHPISLKSK